MATFLWRSAGSPAFGGDHGFADVPAGTYYETAVSWLVEAGITSGTSAGVFSPSAKVTRGQMATFLWRSAGSPAFGGDHGFGDVPAGSYFEVAVGWLADQGITSGTSAGVFSPSALVTRGQMATFLWRASCGVETVETQALPEGNARFVDAIVRDMIGRPPTDQELAGWAGVLDGTVDRGTFVAELAVRDEFLGMVVDNTYVSVLDRLPTTSELAAAIGQVRADGSTTGLAAGLFGSGEFDVLSGSSTVGFVNTLGQRVFKRDLGAVERDPLVTALDTPTVTRTEVATDVYSRETGGRVRAKMWANKLLSRDPTGTELDLWGTQMLGSGELAVVASIGASDAYFDLAQERFVEASLTTAPGTVIVTGPQVVSAVYASDGSGTVVLAAGVVPPAVGDYLVVSNTADPTAGGVGKVTVLAQAGNGQTTVTVVAGGLANAFASGEVNDTTEVTDPNPGHAARSRSAPSGRAAGTECEVAFEESVGADVGIDTRNDSSIKWSFNSFDARIAAQVTPHMSAEIEGLAFSGTCVMELWKLKWDAPIHAGPVTIPGYFEVTSSVGLEAEASALTLSSSVSLPCTIGVKATKSSVENISGCSTMRTTLTFTPDDDLSAKVFGDLKVDYLLGVDKGWTKANIGMTAGLEVGVEARLTNNPGWDVNAYLDGSIDVEGDLGRWGIDENLTERRLKSLPLASGPLGQGTPDGGTYQPGEDTTDTTPLPPDAPISISAGDEHTCALLQNGTAKCWGNNEHGQLGDDSAAGNRLTPTTVAGLTGAVSITAGNVHTCALLQNGTAKCWGRNIYGQLGDGTTTTRSTPTTVTGLTGAVTITAGDYHTCAVLQNGTIKCWGSNGLGELGDGTTDGRLTPTTVTGLTGVVSIIAGYAQTCAVLQNGTAKCWGSNYLGKLGDGTTTDRLTPTTVTGLTGAASMAAGNVHTCAVLQNGTAKCWGSNGYGELGDGTAGNRLTPTTVTGLTGAVSITAGGRRTCALLQNGTAKCWGSNFAGQLGDGTTTHRSTPTMVTGLSEAVSITAGGSHTCAVLQNGTAKCWGFNYVGQLGDDTTTDRTAPTLVAGL
jgi:alpha-tubulin suppressor-like RCC1 family protein